MSEPSVTCRHCGEEIVQRIDEDETYWIHKVIPVQTCSVTAAFAEPIRTVLSAEDRERLNSVLANYDVPAVAVELITAVLANAGGGE